MADAVSILKLVSEASSLLSTSAVAIFGGSVAAVVGTSYRRPPSVHWRLPFLLFVPGWLSLARSLYLGNLISGRYLASTMVPTTELPKIASFMNDEYAGQRDWLLYSLCFFAVWLALYLYYWTFGPATAEKS